MKTILVAAVALVASGATVWAQSGYQDGATQQWFKTLSSVFENNCCDQADCKLAKSTYHDGAWWAVSNRTGAWVKIAGVQVTSSISIFKDGVLCEGNPIELGDASLPTVYCFSPPPLGF